MSITAAVGAAEVVHSETLDYATAAAWLLLLLLC